MIYRYSKSANVPNSEIQGSDFGGKWTPVTPPSEFYEFFDIRRNFAKKAIFGLPPDPPPQRPDIWAYICGYEGLGRGVE